MNEFKTVCKHLFAGESILRAYLNLRLSQESLHGLIIDIGGGKSSDYISFMSKSDDADFLTFDVKSGADIDFEKDKLPANDNVYDTVLFLNVMEHIFNYQHITNEVVRITKTKGQVIGFVPFLMWYHPDHSDFFRYTHEALKKIFTEAGVQDFKIESISPGPFTASFHIILSTLPRMFRVPVYALVYILDKIFLKLRPHHVSKYALGYFFILKP